MYSLIFAFLFTLFLTWKLKKVAYRLELVDRPGKRKHHTQMIPLVGGVAMGFAFLLSMLTLNESLESYYSLFAAMILMVILGIVDDKYELAAHHRFPVQIIAAILIIVIGGVSIKDLGDLLGQGSIALGYESYVVSVFCVVGVINALNMSDGMDGLAGGLAGISTFCLVILVLFSGRHGLDGILLLLLLTVIIGFLCFNLRHPWQQQATVFMGDSGSMMLGLVLAWFLIDLSQGEQRAFSPVTALWIFALPLLDTISIMLRRLLNGQSPFQADRQHLHHLVQAAGFSDCQTTGILLLMAGSLALIGMLSWYLAIADVVMFWAFISVFVVYFYVLKRTDLAMESGMASDRETGKLS